ncbi:site-specific DNA-methyltransferase [bacterium]|nr:site-specific DNA-methyltransferase [bacterium]
MPEKIKVNLPKGRPMLNWIGKIPPEFVQGYPCQLMEVYNSNDKNKFLKTPTYNELENNWYNLLFHGDNKDVLATLLELGFGGKIDLIYIDPPFASKKDYIRKIELKGLKDLGRIEEDDASIIQQKMYEDIWKRDEYFQFMYDRLILLNELLAPTGSIYVHLDYRMIHYIKALMDEIFLESNFHNDIIWYYFMGASGSNRWGRKHQNILYYSKSQDYYFDLDSVRVPYNPETIARAKRGDPRYEDEPDNLEKAGKNPGDVWMDINPIQGNAIENNPFETQKPKALLERIIKASSKENDFILDCFVGSGTTCVASQCLGRRWIGIDVNKGAIQLAGREIQKVIKEQINENSDLLNHSNFATYKVNNYDLRILKTEAKELAIEHYGINRLRTDTFFDGVRDKNELVKIIDFNHPLTLLDLQNIENELSKRPEEDKNIVILCFGRETGCDAWIEEFNKKQPYKDSRTKTRAKQFMLFDLRDKNFIAYEPPKGIVVIERFDNNKVKIEIKDFLSPTIIKRLDIERNLLHKTIPDFRSMIDVVLVDTNYNGDVFNIKFSDVPEKRHQMVKGKYEIEIGAEKTTIAVKILDMLGDEFLVVENI